MVATLWTVGHSTRPLDEFLHLLDRYGVEAIADVRRFPGSRRHPHFAQPQLRASLAEHGIAYHWFPVLGGRRRPRADSPNTAWRNASFRAYADHLDTAEFAGGLDALLQGASELRTAIMCAELLWWRCHRALIADVLRVRGFEVIHILDGKDCAVHPYTSAARIVEGRLSYAG